MRASLRVLLRKEFLELRADRRALLLGVFLPVFLYPGILVFTSTLEKEGEESQSRLASRLVIQGEFAELSMAVTEDERWKRIEFEGLEPRSALEDGEIDLLVVVERNFGENGTDEEASLRLLHHGTRDRSRRALRRMRSLLEDLERTESRRRQAAAGAELPLQERFVLEELDIATEEESSGAEAGGQIVYLLLMTLFIAGSTLASDQVAGEKERGTLETLYLVPLPREQIALSKVLVVVLGTSLSGILSLLSIAACFAGGLVSQGGEASRFSLSSLFAASTLVVPLAALISGVLLAISTYARNLKEAQQLVLPAMLICFGAGLLTYSQALELSVAVALIPVANVALAMRDVLAGQIHLPLVLLTSLASLGWAGLVLRWVARQLRREEMVLGFDPEPLLAPTVGGRRRAAVLALSLTVLAYFYLGSLLQSRWGVRGLVLSLWVLLPVLGAASLRFVHLRDPARSLLSLRMPRPAAWPAVVLLALGSLLPMMGAWVPLQERFLPSPSGGLAELEALFAQLSTAQLLLIGAISPAVCEEFVFRGVFLGIFRRLNGARSAVLTTAIFFGLIHLNVFRFLPTAALGLMLAYVVIRTGSLLPAMLFHAIYNGSLLLGGQWLAGGGFPVDPTGPVAWFLSVSALVGGFALLRGPGARA